MLVAVTGQPLNVIPESLLFLLTPALFFGALTSLSWGGGIVIAFVLVCMNGAIFLVWGFLNYGLWIQAFFLLLFLGIAFLASLILGLIVRKLLERHKRILKLLMFVILTGLLIVIAGRFYTYFYM
ncbi:MAG: hypothetical protein Q8P93_00825 [bacterium]|nr:hypothetical protein [bacterium]